MQEGWLKERQRRLSYSGCKTCGGENPQVCACAREAWMKEERREKGEWSNRNPFEFTPPPPAFGSEEDRLEAEWNKQKETSVGLCAICPRCNGSSMSFCECAKARWMEQKRNGMIKRPKPAENNVFALGVKK